MDKKQLKRFISETIVRAWNNPLYSKEGVIESILYRVDLLEEKHSE